MRKHVSGFFTGLLTGACFATAAVAGVPIVAGAGDSSPQAGGTSTAKVVLENDRVRVRDVTFPPGTAGMHTHTLPHVGVVIQGGTLVFKYPDGKSETAKLEPGGVGYRDANVSHEPVNTGTTPVRVIEVELK
jgi:mannose-6-phosphate isomerase-like protein (cupin superfamily)